MVVTWWIVAFLPSDKGRRLGAGGRGGGRGRLLNHHEPSLLNLLFQTEPFTQVHKPSDSVYAQPRLAQAGFEPMTSRSRQN